MRSPLPAWLIVGTIAALGVNVLASTTTGITIGLMRSHSDFAVTVRAYELATVASYRAVVYPSATAVILAYLWPIVAYFRAGTPEPAPPRVQRRTVNAPLIVALLGFLPWLCSIVLFPLLTLRQFGRWSPDLSSQQIFSPLVNGFLAATVSYLVFDWVFRAMVVPRVFPHGRLAEVPGSVALGVRARLFMFLLAVAFTPLFTVLGLIRAAAARVATGASVADVLAALMRASEITFAVYLGLGIVLALLLARTLSQPLTHAAAALRRIQRGDLTARLQPTSSDEVGVLEDGVNAMVAALQEKARILQTFGRVVEPAVRDRLLAGELRLGGELRAAAVLFCDLRGFTAIAEHGTPAATVATLNECFSILAGWVRECGGFVDKFLGDGMLVVFGLFEPPTPDARARAAAAAIGCGLGMPQRLSPLNRRRQAAGQPPLAIRVGIDSGDVLAGTIGAEDRLEYTVIGDAVNVAARLQELCKERGCSLLVTEAACELAGTAGGAPSLVPFGSVLLRGRQAPVRVFGAG